MISCKTCQFSIVDKTHCGCLQVPNPIFAAEKMRKAFTGRCDDYQKATSRSPALLCGEKYNWRNQPERSIYLGKEGAWHQFALVEEPENVWCEILDQDLHHIERTTAV